MTLEETREDDSLIYLGTVPAQPSRRPVRLMRAQVWRAQAQVSLQRIQALNPIQGVDEVPLNFVQEEDEVISPEPREIPHGQAVQESVCSNETVEGTDRSKPVQVLSTLAASSNKELLNVEVLLDGREVKATINTGTPLNFIAMNTAMELGLVVSPYNTLATTDADAEGASGWVEAALRIGPWEGLCRLFVLPLEDYQVILGLKLCSQAQMAIIPHMSGIMIWGNGTPSFQLACADGAGKAACA